MKISTSVRAVGLVLLAAASGCSSAGNESQALDEGTGSVQQAADNPNRLFGTYCQENYENTWRETLGGTWSTCANFNSSMAALAPRDFYYNMSGAGWHFDQSGDQELHGGLDAVDMIFVNGHGGAWSNPSRATIPMFEQDVRAFSPDWRLGDEGRGLSLFAMHTCDTLKNDGELLNRWVAAFDGGLRIAVGSHDKILASSSSTGDGSRFANNMRSGQKIKDAWKNSLSGTSLDQDAAAVATGLTDAACWARLDSMTWGNLLTTPRLKDAAWQFICTLSWDNV